MGSSQCVILKVLRNKSINCKNGSTCNPPTRAQQWQVLMVVVTDCLLFILSSSYPTFWRQMCFKIHPTTLRWRRMWGHEGQGHIALFFIVRNDCLGKGTITHLWSSPTMKSWSVALWTWCVADLDSISAVLTFCAAVPVPNLPSFLPLHSFLGLSASSCMYKQRSCNFQAREFGIDMTL